MRQNDQAIFLIEQLQPSYLSPPVSQWVYLFASRLMIGLMIGLIVGLVIGLGIGLTVGSISGLIVAFMEVNRFEPNERNRVSRTPRYEVLNSLKIGSGLLFGCLAD
jgi:hypothetical protein